jgi:organic radical activating enzyme
MEKQEIFRKSNAIKRMLNLLEGKRNSKNALYRSLLLSKDILFYSFIKPQDGLKMITKLRYKKTVSRMLFEVCSACQNTCEHCAHKVLRSTYQGYQLSLEDLKKFIYYTKKSRYHIGRLSIHGGGEPLLWKHFNEGIKLLHKSRLINWIDVTSNGQLLHKITPETWGYIDEMIISTYPPFDELPLLKKLQNKYGDKIKIAKMDGFVSLPKKKYENTLPCECVCAGPMFIKDKVFLFCGPPLFNALKLMDVDVFDNSWLYSFMGKNYLDKWDPKKTGNLKFCEYCWANNTILNQLEPAKHRQTSKKNK